MLHKIFLIVLVCININAFTQTCSITISGKISDKHDNSALDYATLYIAETGLITTADSTGKYSLSNICPGKYTFIVEHTNCPSDTILLNISSSITYNFYLEHHTEALAEIITTASKVNKNNTQTINVIDNKTLTKLEGKDLGSIVSTIAGVNVLKTGNTISKPIIHGLYGDRIYLVSNGVKLETQDWGAEHAPEIDPFAASNVKIIKGAGGLEYGTDAMGGMILMEPPILKKSKHINASVSLVGQTNGHGITTSARIEQGFAKNVAYFLQGTFKNIGDQQAPHYNLSNTGLREGDFSTGIGILKKNWDINAYYSMFHQELGILKSSHIGNITDLENAIASDTPLIVLPFTYKIENPKQKITHHLAKLNIAKYFKNQHQVSITYSFQLNNRKEYDIRRGGRSAIPALDMRLISNNLASAYTRTVQVKKESKIEGKTGFNFSAKHNANNPETGIRPLIPDYYQYGIGVYDMEKYSIKNFIIEAGARYDFTRFYAYKFDRNNTLLKPVFNFHTYAFNVGGSWKNKNQIIQLQSNISYSSRFPNASELFSDGLHHGIAALEFGNENLKPEHGVKWINTLNVNYKKYISAELSFYASKIKNFIYLAPLPNPILTIRGAFPAFQYYQTNARLLGFDANINIEPTNFLLLNFKSSIIRGRNITTKDNLIYMPSDRISAAFDIHHDFKKIKNAYIGMNVLHVFKQTKTPALIIDYKAAPNAYTTLNAEVGFDYTITAKHTLSFSITGENITNAVYRDYLNKFRYFADELGWNLIFRLKYSFL